jgi:AhpC/TSA family
MQITSSRLKYLGGIVLLGALLPAVLLGQEAKPLAASEAAANSGADPASLATLVEKLTPEHRKAFAEMLAADWQDRRAEWADMLIALLKREQINLGVGWFQPGVPKYDWKWLSTKLDANKDGLIAKDELPKDAPYPDLFYSRLDRDGDGEIRSADFDFFSRQPPTTPQMLSRFLATVLDADSNGRITAEEIQNWLKGADKEQAGFLTVDDLNEDFNRAIADLNSGGDDMPGPDKMLGMFFRGELGVWGAGPKLGEEAPDFTLPTHDGKETVTLSKSRGKPVILIFGSFT